MLPSVFNRRGSICQLPTLKVRRVIALRRTRPAEATSSNVASARINRTESGQRCKHEMNIGYLCSCQIWPRRLETDGSQIYVDRDVQNLRETKTEVKIRLRFDRNTEFLTAQEKPPTNLTGQIAERNETRFNAFS